jgi:glycyl-tRNA synthetase
LKLHESIAPFQYAVLPLSNKEPLLTLAEEVMCTLEKQASVDFDVTGSVGKRYRRQDEIGTPQCVTIDFDSLEDACVTVRNRDTMQQERISIEELYNRQQQQQQQQQQ